MLGDCGKCWDRLCTCGWQYRGWHTDGIKRHIVMLEAVLEYKIKINPGAKFSGIRENDTEDDLKFMTFLRDKQKEEAFKK
jgi:hypothetical protein